MNGATFGELGHPRHFPIKLRAVLVLRRPQLAEPELSVLVGIFRDSCHVFDGPVLLLFFLSLLSFVPNASVSHWGGRAVLGGRKSVRRGSSLDDRPRCKPKLLPPSASGI